MTQPEDMPTAVTREDALALLEAIGTGRPDRELIPLVSAMTTHDDEQTFAILRGACNEMSPPTQLASLLETAGLVSMDEAFEALKSRRDATRKAVQ